MSAALLSAYVLHSRAYRDSSRIADLYSLEQGRVSAVFKGSRSVGKKRGVPLEPFSRLAVSLSGRANLKTGAVRESQRQYQLQGSTALYSGLYVNELLVRLLHEGDANLAVFAAYEWLLSKLASQVDISDCLRAFEYTLLQSLGYPLTFDSDADGNRIDPTAVYYLAPEQGFVATAQTADNRQYYSGACLSEIANLAWQPDSRSAAKHINRAALQHLLGDKPLLSRQLFRAGQ